MTAAVSPGVVASILRAYRDPRGEMARLMADGLTEPRTLMHAFLACALAFVASLPNAVREAAALDLGEDRLAAAVAAHAFLYVFWAPLALYGIAALLHLGAMAFGARGPFLNARAALFWSLVLGAPIALALALLGVGAEAAFGPGALGVVDYVALAALLGWLWLFSATFAEAEGFARTGRVLAALVGLVAVAALGLRALSGA
jgi:hypothetical protein